MPSLRTTSLEYRGVVSTGRIGGGALTDRARVLAKPPCLAPMFGGLGPGQDYTAGKQSRWPTRPTHPRQGKGNLGGARLAYLLRYNIPGGLSACGKRNTLHAV